MVQWKKLRVSAGQSLDYDSFGYKRELNDVLRKEQHGICCYCQRRVDHFQGDKATGAHNEHLIPENGPQGVFEQQMDYGNLYACCIESQGTRKKEKSKIHCGEAKADDLIYPFIQMKNCSDYFKYNNNGEILPAGAFDTWNEYIASESTLNGLVLDAFKTIKILNLNCLSLVVDRKKTIQALISLISKMDKVTVARKMNEFENLQTFPVFIDMLLYYMKRKK